jgi:hypothetical protein
MSCVLKKQELPPVDAFWSVTNSNTIRMVRWTFTRNKTNGSHECSSPLENSSCRETDLSTRHRRVIPSSFYGCLGIVVAITWSMVKLSALARGGVFPGTDRKYPNTGSRQPFRLALPASTLNVRTTITIAIWVSSLP